MDIKHLTSGSKGNAILLHYNNSTLLLDGGVKVSQLVKHYNVRISKLSGVLITHEHMDHALAVEELLYRCVPVYTSRGTAHKLVDKMDVRGIKIMKERVTYQIGEFKVVPVVVEHDAAEPFAFYIKAGDSKLLYCTDSNKIPKLMGNVTHYVIECNYDAEILAKVNRSEYTKARIKKTHSSIQDIEAYFSDSSIDLSSTKVIILVHLSDMTADAMNFIKKVQKSTGIPTYAW